MSIRYKAIKARPALSAWLKSHGIKHIDLAELLGIQAKDIANWTSGLTRPGLSDREAIQVLTNIPVTDWLSEEEAAARKDKFERLDRLAKTKARPQDVFQRIARRI
jgi:transcriptional regulator with XRE-family HTH domain